VVKRFISNLKEPRAHAEQTASKPCWDFACREREKVHFKGLVYSKNENSVINYSASCYSKPVRLSLIFRKEKKDLFDEI